MHCRKHIREECIRAHLRDSFPEASIGVIDNPVQNGVQKRMYARTAALLDPQLKTTGLKHHQSFVYDGGPHAQAIYDWT